MSSSPSSSSTNPRAPGVSKFDAPPPFLPPPVTVGGPGRPLLREGPIPYAAPPGPEEQQKLVDEMVAWFYARHPGVDIVVPSRPFLRMHGGGADPVTGSSVSWANTLAGDVREWRFAPDLEVLMDRLAEFAITYGVVCTRPEYKMPARYLAAYANYFTAVKRRVEGITATRD